MAAPEQQRWLGPLWRDGRWWMVRADGDEVGWADDVGWHRGWPPGPRRLLTRLLVVLAVAYAVAVPGWLLVAGRLCGIPECEGHPDVAVQEPSTTGRLPTVLAAPCSRVPVDEVLVERVVDDAREPMLRLVRSGGDGARVFPLDRTVPGYRETTGRPPQDLVTQLTRYREQQAQPPGAAAGGRLPGRVTDSSTVVVTLRYADGTSSPRTLPSGVQGEYSYEVYWPPGDGALTADYFATTAAGSDVCLPRGVRPGDWVVGVGALLAGFGIGVAVRSVRRGRYADELVRMAAAPAPDGARAGP